VTNKTPAFSLREKKKAKAKLQVLKTTMELLQTNSFRNISVEEICSRCEISKVTFFNYFPKKEDILSYFIAVWSLERMIEQIDHPKRGLQAIRHLMHSVIRKDQNRQSLMLTLISHFSELPAHPATSALSDVEISLLHPEREDLLGVPIPSLYERFLQHLEEGVQAGEIRDDLSMMSLLQILFTFFYGVHLSAQICGLSDNLPEQVDVLLSLIAKERVH
jgi:AcrR family transcriptional regulator